jgi:hypothetical protein
MKSVKLKTETVILGAVIAALLLYLALRDPDRVNYRLPDLPAVAAGEIDRIDIARANASIRLEKKDGQWLIQPRGFLSDADKIRAILGDAAGLSLTALVSESGNYFPYGLDKENEIKVGVYKGQRLLREFSVGSAASTYSHTFVKLAGDPRVFHARKSFRSDFDQTVDGLRDKNVLRFAKDDITAVEITTAGGKVHFKKIIKPVAVTAAEKAAGRAEPPATEASWVMADGKTGNAGELNAIIDQTAQLACEGFIEGKTGEDFKDAVYTVLLKGRKDLLLSIFAKAEKEVSYPAVSSESPYPFLLSAYKAESIMKKLADLKNEKTAGK